ncbi:MAG: UDP-N-acetylmuramoyl-L-alanine--D-glutamate ligase [Clostridia bacterium]|nr:UDP-N-acetylmuramoyl-L-alanine--D-glutamate ligase [Clostridia bacterium]
MSFFEQFKDKKVTLLGAGVSNKPLVAKLAEGGAKIEIRDKKTLEQMGDAAAEFVAAGAEFVSGEGYLDDIDGDYVFRSPGFRPDIEPLKKAQERGVKLTSEMEMFLANSPCPVIALTGSDGKSTTTTLVANILRESGHNCFLGGNIGEPLLNRIDAMKEDDIIAVELSSFQLMTIDSPLTVAAIKNITPNHLNWHTGMDEYIAAKAKILDGCSVAVLNYDDEICRSLADRAENEVLWFSRNRLPDGLDGAFIDGGELVMRYKGEETFIIKTEDILLPGEHNAENYATAVAATWGRATVDAIRKVAMEFGGVKHRLQLIRRDGGISYYNSSIDSSPTRTAAAISALDCPINIICGGYDKNIPFEPLADALIAHGKIKTVVLTGATMDKIKEALVSHKDFEASKIKMICEPDFKAATLAAAGEAEAGDAVLLSPACASFDAFENFEKRGEYFAEIIRGL